MALVASACASPLAASTDASPGATAAGASPEVGARQQHEAGSVTVTASWIAGTSAALVEMDTHSVDLDGLDLKELARVRLDGGAWIDATAWDAPTGGHHRGGRLTFGSIGPQAIASANVIELEIRGVGAVHLLRWGPPR